MNKKRLITEILLSAVIIVLLILLINPFSILMPDPMVMTITVGLVILFAVFTGFVWQEKAHDEREAFHRMIAGRVAFLSGTGVIVIGILVQNFRHELDKWLVVSLGVMVIAKLAGLLYGRLKY